jgi:hypothetical protein
MLSRQIKTANFYALPHACKAPVRCCCTSISTQYKQIFMKFNIQELYTQNSQAISAQNRQFHITTYVHFIFLSMYYNENCFKQKLLKEMKAHSHLKSGVINRSYMTHGESFTSRSIPNNVINTNLFSFCSQ